MSSTPISSHATLSRNEPVIRIERQYVLAIGRPEAGIARGRRSQVRLIDATRHTRGERPQQFARVRFVGPVIDNDDFCWLMGLRRHAVDGLSQEVRGIVTRDNDRDQNLGP